MFVLAYINTGQLLFITGKEEETWASLLAVNDLSGKVMIINLALFLLKDLKKLQRLSRMIQTALVTGHIEKDMGAAVILFLLILIGLGVAYHMGILEPYIKEAQARMKQGEFDKFLKEKKLMNTR
ncbi:ATP-dependent Clp protease ATP-binding subunit ClpX [Dirofilaria immitis]